MFTLLLLLIIGFVQAGPAADKGTTATATTTTTTTGVGVPVNLSGMGKALKGKAGMGKASETAAQITTARLDAMATELSNLKTLLETSADEIAYLKLHLKASIQELLLNQTVMAADISMLLATVKDNSSQDTTKNLQSDLAEVIKNMKILQNDITKIRSRTDYHSDFEPDWMFHDPFLIDDVEADFNADCTQDDIDHSDGYPRLSIKCRMPKQQGNARHHR